MRATRDWQAQTDLMEDIDTRLQDDQKSAARKIVCGCAQGSTFTDQVADAQLLMNMLGIAPGQVVDDECLTDPPHLIADSSFSS